MTQPASQADLFYDMIFDGYDQTTIDTFKRYHNERPEIYRKFVNYALDMRKVRPRYSQKTLMEVIRWNQDIGHSTETFKINNNWIAIYSRMAMRDFKELRGFFQTRTIRGLNNPNFEAEDLCA